MEIPSNQSDVGSSFIREGGSPAGRIPYKYRFVPPSMGSYVVGSETFVTARAKEYTDVTCPTSIQDKRYIARMIARGEACGALGQ